MVENNDRRYAPIGMSDKKPKSENIEYYNELYKAVMNPMVQKWGGQPGFLDLIRWYVL